MADVFKTRGKLLQRARRQLDHGYDGCLGAFGIVYEELLWDVEVLGKIIALVNSRSRREWGQEDDTLDKLRDLLHEEDYTA